MRIELTHTGATIQRSHQLSYRHHVAQVLGLEPRTTVLETAMIAISPYLRIVPQSGFEPIPSVCNTETLPLRHRGKCVYERT